MRKAIKHSIAKTAALCVVSAMALTMTGCSTVPKAADRPAFLAESRAASQWFENNVYGLKRQIDRSAGYIVFPGIGQWGLVFTGGKFGRGVLYGPDNRQMGWAAVSTGSLGLQAGVQGFKMLVVFENKATLNSFKENSLKGAASAVAVLGEAGGSGAAPFENGVAVYQGANTGLMAGVNIGLDYLRFEEMED